MIKKKQNFKFIQLKEINTNETRQIVKLILKENPEALLALNYKNISTFLNNVANSKNLILFVLKKKETIIAYAVIAKTNKFFDINLLKYENEHFSRFINEV